MPGNPMIWLFVTAISGSIIWGIVNILKRYYLDSRGYNVHEDVVAVYMMSGMAISALFVQLVVDGLPKVDREFWLPFVISTLINFWIQYWNIRALKLEDASIVVPLASTMPMMVIFTSWFMHHEWPTLWGRLGISCIAFGAYILNLKGTNFDLPPLVKKFIPKRFYSFASFYFQPWFRLYYSQGARLALGSAYLGAIAINFDRTYVEHSSPATATFSAYTIIALAIFLWSNNRKKRWAKLDKLQAKKIFAIGLFFGLGCVLMNWSFHYGIVPYVGTLRRTQILWTVVLAAWLLKEKHGLQRTIGALIIFLGTIFIAF